MRRRVFLASVGAVTAGTAGCLGSGSSQEPWDVGMSTRRYRPGTFAVTPGTTVVWLNTSKQGHSVTAYEDAIPEDADYFASGGYDSEAAARQAWRDETGGRLIEGDRFEHTFEVPGSYQYFCIPHETAGMVATIEVTEDADVTRTPRG